MSWREHHRRSEEIAGEADVAMRVGNVRHAQELYRRAADEERLAIADLDPSKVRTFSISAVAIASIYFQGQLFDEAERTACEFFASDRASDWARQELRTLLVSIYALKEADPIYAEDRPGMLSVSLRGGDIERGGAPATLVGEKLKTLVDMFYRTVEYLDGRPYRVARRVPADLHQNYRPWMTQLAPGSFRFGVGFHTPMQTLFLSDDEWPVQRVSEELLSIVHEATGSSMRPISELISASDYRMKFLRLTRNLAPAERASFKQIGLRDASSVYSTTLSNESRKAINNTIRKEVSATAETGHVAKTIVGVLRALDLERDWIKVAHENKLITIKKAGEAIDDVIGSMVNNEVIVQVVRTPSTVYHFRDIELVS